MSVVLDVLPAKYGDALVVSYGSGKQLNRLIIDGGRHIATGCPADGAATAQLKLAAYIADKYQPVRRERDLVEVDIATVLSMYVDDCGERQANRTKFDGRIERLNEFWGGKTLADVTGETCREYARHHSRGGARRDLEDLALPSTTMQAGVDKWEAAGFLGVSVEMLDRVYGHHHPDHLRTAARAISYRRQSLPITLPVTRRALPRSTLLATH